ncbi:diacylglycerol kinase [Agaribacter marinus]|uniref:Diacylglycerol kinase family protein n=2 Tax=Virgibacillus salarius TaxID=447199 RepID=A0A941IDC7_9BACI|nr:diacylglycerol kinase family protein [Virgibacillus salarius]NAZ09705.1 diacylglycerol kinase [Agaribacter marinus]
MSLELKDNKKSIGFSYAWNGIMHVIKHERNFRLHLVSASLVIVAGFICRLSSFEWMFILLAIGLVLTAELINSAMESMMDYLKPDIHPIAKQIKDMAAGAVLISAITAAGIGLIIFAPKLVLF